MYLEGTGRVIQKYPTYVAWHRDLGSAVLNALNLSSKAICSLAGSLI